MHLTVLKKGQHVRIMRADRSYFISPSVVQESEEAFRNFSQKPQSFPTEWLHFKRKCGRHALRPALPLSLWMTLRNIIIIITTIVILLSLLLTKLMENLKYSIYCAKHSPVYCALSQYMDIRLKYYYNLYISWGRVDSDRFSNLPKFSQWPLCSSVKCEYHLPHRAVMSLHYKRGWEVFLMKCEKLLTVPTLRKKTGSCDEREISIPWELFRTLWNLYELSLR